MAEQDLEDNISEAVAADIRGVLIQYCDIKQEYDYIRAKRDKLRREIEKMENCKQASDFLYYKPRKER